MDKRAFLQHVLPPLETGAYVFLVGIKGKRVVPQPFTSIDDLVEAAEASQHLDLYFTPLTFNKRDRKARYAYQGRAFFIDLDVGPKKPHSTQDEAANALRKFLEDTGFPRPTVVLSSGIGLHAYWIVDEVQPAAWWVKTAEQFKAFCLQNNLHIDPAPTADRARIMRLPGTVNHKHGKRPTKILYAGKRMPLAEFTKHLSATQATDVPSYLQGTDVDEQLGVISSHTPKWMKNIVAQCPLMHEVEKTGGAKCREPLWRLTLMLAAFCEDGDDYVHPLSNKHHDYDPATVDRKYNQCKRVKTSSTIGPAKCETFKRDNTDMDDLCSSCEHYGVINSPISLGAPKAEPTQPPKQYRVANGAIYFNTDNGPRRICANFELSVENYGDAEGSTSMLVMKFSNGGRAIMNYASTHDIAEIRKRSGDRLGLAKSDVSMFDRMVTSWIGELRASSNGYTSLPARIGWGDSWDTFTFTDRVLRKDSHGVAAQKLHGIGRLSQLRPLRSMHRQGDFPVWQKHVQMLVDTGVPEAHVILAQAFAAPLTDLLPDPPAVTMLVSEHSGAGKSTLFRAANSVWFGRERGINMADTDNYINGTIMASHSVPVLWDELHVQSSIVRERERKLESVASIVFRVLQGMDKGRMDAGANIKDKLVNRPLVLISSNMPLAEMLTEHHVASPEAMAARMLQLTIRGRPKGRIQFSPLDDNFGIAGEVFIRALMLEGKRAVQDRLTGVMQKLNQPVFDGPGRMWRANIALTLTAAFYVNKFQILKLDMNTILKVMGAAATATKASTNKAGQKRDAFQVLEDIIHIAKTNHEIIITTCRPQRGQTGKTMAIAYTPVNRVTLWLAPDDDWGRIRKTLLELLLNSRGLVADKAVKTLLDSGVLTKHTNATYDPRDTAHAMRTACYEINLNTLRNLIKKRPS